MKQNRVPAPWTPISVNETEEGISVSVLGRVYNFGHSMFPQSITADGEELLSEPIRLLAQDNGADAVWRNSETWVHETSGRRVVLMSATESRFAVISTIITIDYDGCIQYDMRLSTCADSVREGFDVEPDMDKRVVNRLWLEVPLKKEHSVFEHRNEAYYSGYSRDISLPFTPISWFGSDKRGLEICFESNEHWNPLSKEQAIETFADEAKRTLRFRFLDDQPKR